VLLSLVGRLLARSALPSGGGRSPSFGSVPGADPGTAGDQQQEALVKLAKYGDREAFAVLYDRHVTSVYRYVYHRVGDRALAEDLTSETFLRALHRIGTFTWQGSDVGAWLVTIARNLIIDRYRSARYRLEVTTDQPFDAVEVDGPEDTVLDRMHSMALIAAVKLLTAQQQECVALRFLEGYTIAETARIMGKSEGAVKTLQLRAVRALARLLGSPP
jgi:RNA polymerase sigma-70 factor, ECF subfamily